MLAYSCENCKQIILWGCINKYNQHFCNEKCYEEYCKKNNYQPHIEELQYIKGIFN